MVVGIFSEISISVRIFSDFGEASTTLNFLIKETGLIKETPPAMCNVQVTIKLTCRCGRVKAKLQSNLHVTVDV